MEVIFLTESTEIAIYPTKPNKLISMHFEMINNMLMELLEEKSLKADPPNSSQEMMRVLPEQVKELFSDTEQSCFIKFKSLWFV